MRFAQPWGLALLALAIPVVVLHILRPHRQTTLVSSTFLWRNVERPVSSATPWQKFRWSALLAAQLLAVLFGSIAVAQPVRLTPAMLAEHTVFIIDASGSMAAVDGDPDRLAAAKSSAEDLRDELPAGGIASIVVAAGRPPRGAHRQRRPPGLHRCARDGDRHDRLGRLRGRVLTRSEPRDVDGRRWVRAAQ